MRAENAIYGGEMSAHHYFRDFAYCDNGTIPWLLVAQLISESGRTLSQLVGERMRRFPASGEINRKVGDIATVLADVERHRSEEHTSELQSLMRISYAVFCLKQKINNNAQLTQNIICRH